MHVNMRAWFRVHMAVLVTRFRVYVRARGCRVCASVQFVCMVTFDRVFMSPCIRVLVQISADISLMILMLLGLTMFAQKPRRAYLPQFVSVLGGKNSRNMRSASRRHGQQPIRKHSGGPTLIPNTCADVRSQSYIYAH